MPIGNDSYVNNTLEVLKAFLVSSYPIYKRKNIKSGYGLKKEDLNRTHERESNEKIHSASSKMFSSRKEYLLNNYMIMELPSNERGKFYGITPIGISYFSKHASNIDTMIFQRIITHFRFFYEKGKSRAETSSYWKKLPHDKTHAVVLKDVLSNIKGQDEKLFKSTIMNYKLPTGGIDVFMTQIHFDKDTKKFFIDFDLNEKLDEDASKPINQDRFNHLFSKFVINSVLHTLYHSQMLDIQILEKRLSDERQRVRKKAKEEAIQAKKTLDAFDRQGLSLVEKFNKDIIKAIKLHTDDFLKKTIREG